jgi:type VI secretion system protein ImpK
MPNSDDPFVPAEPTRIRPRPGAGRRTVVGPAGQPYAAPPRAVFGAPQPFDEPAARFVSSPVFGRGLNPLVEAATHLLLLTAQVRDLQSPMEIAGLRQHALDEIRRFEEHARNAGISNQVVISARYALCAALDEAVLATPWGSDSEWAQHPLLVTLHREAWGGEKFFEVLDRVSQDPQRFIDLMELLYICLAFGFEGKFHLQDRGQDRLRDIHRDLYRKIRQQGGGTEPDLSLRWRGVEERGNPIIRYVPAWVVAAAALAILAIAFSAYLASLRGLAQPVQIALASVGLEDFSSAAPVVVRGPTLKQLLADDERAGAISVEERGAQTLITLLGSDLFASGSAMLNPTYEPTLRHLTAALNQVPGRVRVVGHTDDQPVRSIRYDNFTLSRERALSVSAVLEQNLDNRARITPQGVGASQPRYQPESDPANRARNRRVEIIHLRAS